MVPSEHLERCAEPLRPGTASLAQLGVHQAEIHAQLYLRAGAAGTPIGVDRNAQTIEEFIDGLWVGE